MLTLNIYLYIFYDQQNHTFTIVIIYTPIYSILYDNILCVLSIITYISLCGPVYIFWRAEWS